MTLIELLVALCLLSLMAVAGYRGIAGLQQADGQLAAHLRDARELDEAFATLASDFRAAGEGPFVAPDAQHLRFLCLTNNGVVRPTQLVASDGQLLRQTGNLPAGTLLAGVEALSFQFLDSDGSWRASWPAQPEQKDLPRAVAVNLRVHLASRPPEAIRRIFEVRG